MPDETITLPRTPQFDRLEPDFRETSTLYRFELRDGRSFLLTLQRGRLQLREGREDAACVLECSPEDFQRLLTGGLNLLTSLMRGDIQIHGDLTAAKRLYRYLRLANAKGDRP